MNGIIILARLDSTRFPNKALTQVGGKPLIQHCIDEVKKLKGVRIILATSDRFLDDPLAEIANVNQISCFRGNLVNVAKRVLDCIIEYKIDNFARVNGDSPLIQSKLLIRGFQMMKEGEYDLVTNLLPRRYPYGISVEIISGSTFKGKYSEIASSTHYSEHITSIFYEQAERFNICSFPFEDVPDHSQVHLTVDTAEDKVMMDRLFASDPDIRDKSIEEIVRQYYKTHNQ